MASTVEYLISPPVYYGFNSHANNFYTFRDTKSVEHTVASFDDAKTLLLRMYDNILKSLGKTISSEKLEQSIKKAPNGKYAYFYLKLC